MEATSIIHQEVERNNEYNTCLFAPIGTDKLAIVYSNKISVYNVSNGRRLSDLNFGNTNGGIKKSKIEINLLKSHGNDTLIGVADSTIRVWKVDNCEPLYVIQHPQPVTSLLINKNSFICGSRDGTITFREVNTGNIITRERPLKPSSEISSMHMLNEFMLAIRTPKTIKVYYIKDNSYSDVSDYEYQFGIESLQILALQCFFE